MASLTEINSNLFGGIGNAFKTGSVTTMVGWLILAVVICAGIGWYYFYRLQKKTFNQKITIFEVVGNSFTPIGKDLAKIVKLGKGGFVVLYLKKNKTWKLAYGGRVGKDTYYFFVDPVGYWYNAMLGANIMEIDKQGGYIPITTTNPLMRGQYTALEKQIDALHGDKKSFWEQYGNWVMSIAFIMVFGIFAWLMFRELSTVANSLAASVDKMAELMDTANQLLINANNQNNGLIQR